MHVQPLNHHDESRMNINPVNKRFGSSIEKLVKRSEQVGGQ